MSGLEEAGDLPPRRRGHRFLAFVPDRRGPQIGGSVRAELRGGPHDLWEFFHLRITVEHSGAGMVLTYTKKTGT